MARKKTPPHGFDFNRSEAAAYVGESVASLNLWGHKRINLSYVLTGGRAWYRQSDCDAYLRRRTIRVAA